MYPRDLFHPFFHPSTDSIATCSDQINADASADADANGRMEHVIFYSVRSKIKNADVDADASADGH